MGGLSDISGNPTSSSAAQSAAGSIRGADLALGGINIGSDGGGVTPVQLGIAVIVLAGAFFWFRRKA